MKIMISSRKSRGADHGHRRPKEKGTLGISIFCPKKASLWPEWPNNEDIQIKLSYFWNILSAEPTKKGTISETKVVQEK